MCLKHKDQPQPVYTPPQATPTPPQGVYPSNDPPAAKPVAAAPVPPTPISESSPGPWVTPPYTGPYRDINGKPDPMGQYQEYNWRQAKAAADEQANSVYKGPVPVSSLTDDDKMYLLYCVRNYGMGNAVQLFYAVCSGPKIEIDRAIAFADSHFGNFTFTTYDQAKLGGYVDQFNKGTLKPIY